MILNLFTSLQQIDPRTGIFATKKLSKKHKLKQPEVNLDFLPRLLEIHHTIHSNTVLAKKERLDFMSNNDTLKEATIKDNISIYLSRINSAIARGENMHRLVTQSHSEKQNHAGKFANTDNSLRIISTLIGVLRMKFVILINNFNYINMMIKNSFREKIKRQLRLLDDEITDEKIGKLLIHPEQLRMFTEEKIYGGRRTMMNAASDIDEKMDEIKLLEENMKKLTNLIKSLHNLVSQQNQVVFSIEETVNSVQNHAVNAEALLITGKEYYTSAKQV